MPANKEYAVSDNATHPLVEMTAEQTCAGGPTEYLIWRLPVDKHRYLTKRDVAHTPERARETFEKYTGIQLDTLPRPLNVRDVPVFPRRKRKGRKKA